MRKAFIPTPGHPAQSIFGTESITRQPYPNDDVTITNVFTAPSGKTSTIGDFSYDTNT